MATVKRTLRDFYAEVIALVEVANQFPNMDVEVDGRTVVLSEIVDTANAQIAKLDKTNANRSAKNAEKANAFNEEVKGYIETLDAVRVVTASEMKVEWGVSSTSKASSILRRAEDLGLVKSTLGAKRVKNYQRIAE